MSFIELLKTSSFDLVWQIPAVLLAAFLMLRLLRALLWRIFSFDKRVARILEQKKSSEVRTGKISEALSPFLDSFPVDVRKPGTSTVFLGGPVDFIHFDPDEGVFLIEVKSGEARLNGTQRKIKSLVQEGRVQWRECKVK